MIHPTFHDIVDPLYEFVEKYPPVKPLVKEDEDLDISTEESDDLDDIDQDIDGIVDAKGIARNLKGVIKECKDPEGFLKIFKIFAHYFFTFACYPSINKDNIIYLSSFISPESSKIVASSIKIYDVMYKWLLNISSLSLNIYEALGVQSHQKRTLQLRKRNETIHATTEKTETISDAKLDKILKQLNEFESSLEMQSKKLFAQIQKDVTRFSAMLLSLSLAIHGICENKVADKIGKFGEKIFTNISNLYGCLEDEKINKRWRFHLNTNFETFIEPNKKFKKLEDPKHYAEHENKFKDHIVANHTFRKKVMAFKEDLETATNMDEVKKKFKEFNIPMELPSSISLFKRLLKDDRFSRDLFQEFYYHEGKRVSNINERILQTLELYENEQNDNITRSIPIISQKLNKLSNVLDYLIDPTPEELFETINRFLKKRHMDLSTLSIKQDPAVPPLPFPPQNITEWSTCIKSEEFKRALATQWIDYNETTGKMAMQGLRQALISKHEIETHFLLIREIQIAIGIIFGILQAASIIPYLNISPFLELLEIIGADITKIFPCSEFIYLGFPHISEFKTKIDDLASQLVRHFLAIKYKPNEFSVESYSLTFQKKFYDYSKVVYSTLFILNYINYRSATFLTKYILEKIVDKPEDNAFYKNLVEIEKNNDEEYKKISEQFKKINDEIIDALQQLKIDDANLIMQPHVSNPIFDLASIIEGNENEEDEENYQEGANFNFFTTEAQEFFENHAMFKFRVKPKKELKSHLEMLMTMDDNKIFKEFAENRYSYLKV